MAGISSLSLPVNRRHFLASSLAFTLGACAASTQRSPSITFWTMQLKPTFEQYMTDLITAFIQLHPGSSVEWVDVPWGDMESKILTAMAGNTAPDVVNLNPQFATKLAEKGALINVAEQLDPQAQAAYFPNLWRANQLGDQTFGLPWYVTTDITVYNRSLFEQAGLDPQQPPQTYAELATVAQTLKEKTGKYAFLLTMDGGQVMEAMVQMGLTLFTPDGKAGFNNEAGKAAFNYWITLFQAGVIPREILTESHRRAIELYQAGELALLLTGPQLLIQLQQNAPQIAQVSQVADQIAGPDGRKSASVMNVVVSQRSPRADLALNFARFLTNSQNQLQFCQLANTLPSTVKTAEDPYFSAESDDLLDQARLVSASQLASSAVLIPPVQGLDILRQAIYEELQLAMLGEKTVDQAVSDAAQRWDERA